MTTEEFDDQLDATSVAIIRHTTTLWEADGWEYDQREDDGCVLPQTLFNALIYSIEDLNNKVEKAADAYVHHIALSWAEQLLELRKSWVEEVNLRDSQRTMELKMLRESLKVDEKDVRKAAREKALEIAGSPEAIRQWATSTGYKLPNERGRIPVNVLQAYALMNGVKQ